MNNKILLDFLEGTGKDKHGRTIYEIWNFTDDQLESVHNYIQWLFPLREMSDNVMGSPFLDNEEDIQNIRQHQTIQENLITSLMRMQNFYRDNDFWLQPNDHNHLRITRILKSTALLSSKENAKEFYDFVMGRVGEFQPVTDESLDYWLKATSS